MLSMVDVWDIAPSSRPHVFLVDCVGTTSRPCSLCRTAASINWSGRIFKTTSMFVA